MKNFKKNIAKLMTLAIIVTCMATIANNIKFKADNTISCVMKDPNTELPDRTRNK